MVLEETMDMVYTYQWSLGSQVIHVKGPTANTPFVFILSKQEIVGIKFINWKLVYGNMEERCFSLGTLFCG
jgi:hypothetical protein